MDKFNPNVRKKFSNKLVDILLVPTGQGNEVIAKVTSKTENKMYIVFSTVTMRPVGNDYELSFEEKGHEKFLTFIMRKNCNGLYIYMYESTVLEGNNEIIVPYDDWYK